MKRKSTRPPGRSRRRLSVHQINAVTRYWNNLQTGLEILYGCAIIGSEDARDELRSLAERVNSSASKISQAEDWPFEYESMEQ
jgi:hypothetical protein